MGPSNVSFSAKPQPEIEEELRRRIEHLGEVMEAARLEVDRLDLVISDALGSADGTLAARQCRTMTAEYWALRTRYAAALQDFSNYVLFGLLPPDFPTAPDKPNRP